MGFIPTPQTINGHTIFYFFPLQNKKKSLGHNFSFFFFQINIYIFFLHMAPAFQPPYAVPVPGAVQKDGETLPHRHFRFADKLVDHPENIFTLWDMYLNGYNLAGGKSSCVT